MERLNLEIAPSFQGFLYIEPLDAQPKIAEAVAEAPVRTFDPNGGILAPNDLLLVTNCEQMGFKQILTTGIVIRV